MRMAGLRSGEDGSRHPAPATGHRKRKKVRGGKFLAVVDESESGTL